MPKAKTKAVADADTEGIILEKPLACFTSAVWKQFGFVVTTNQAGSGRRTGRASVVELLYINLSKVITCNFNYSVNRGCLL